MGAKGKMMMGISATIAVASCSGIGQIIADADWKCVPLAGNAYITQGLDDGAGEISENGLNNWTGGSVMCSGWFHIEKPGELDIGLRLKVPEGKSTVKITVNGSTFSIKADNREYQNLAAGKVNIEKPGYVQVALHGEAKTGTYFADISDFIIHGTAAEGAVFADDPDNFYWSRRGPSVHLAYPLADGIEAEWFYNELTVPEGEDEIGSYFMSNGFGEGYFGIQVNSETERRVLFSVWDPPEGSGMTESTRHGEGVTVQRFGGEGTGGQSYCLFDWKAGTTYGFLTQVKPDGSGSTVYSSWFFAPETGSWKFMATWKRPSTSKFLTRPHSFLENFLDYNGWLDRKCHYNNQWIVTSGGEWQELTAAKFTGDATAVNSQRMDFDGGLDTNGKFYLKNGGFFNRTGQLNKEFSRPPTGIHPVIDFSQLP